MAFKRLRVLQMLLWLLAAFTLTKQDMVSLHVGPAVVAACGDQATLHCNVSSRRDGLSIKQLEWFEDSRPLCEVVDGGNVTHHPGGGRDFHCEYEERRLTLVLHRVWPLDAEQSNRFMCKLKSNQGIKHKRSRVHLQECCGSVRSGTHADGPVCTFNHVYPDADVLWFDGARGPLKQKVSKSVDDKGWMTIISELEESAGVFPNCTLRSQTSQNPITCPESRELLFLKFPTPSPTIDQKNGGVHFGPFGVLLAVALSLSAAL